MSHKLLCLLQVQEVGLAVAYGNDKGIHRYVKMLMALPYLPHREIPASFHQRLKLQATTPMLHELVDYVAKQWIHFPPSFWSIYRQHVCTNDDIQGWRNSFNQHTGGRVHLKSAFDFVFKGQVSLGQPTHPQVLLGSVVSNHCVVIMSEFTATSQSCLASMWRFLSMCCNQDGMFSNVPITMWTFFQIRMLWNIWINNSKNHTVPDITSFFYFSVLLYDYGLCDGKQTTWVSHFTLTSFLTFLESFWALWNLILTLGNMTINFRHHDLGLDDF